MAPKKKVDDKKMADPAQYEDKGFRWTPENDRKLLLLALGRASTGRQDYESFVQAMPGTNFQGVRQRLGKFRAEQRKLYEELGWEHPEKNAKTQRGTAQDVKKPELGRLKPKASLKRVRDDEDDIDEDPPVKREPVD